MGTLTWTGLDLVNAALPHGLTSVEQGGNRDDSSISAPGSDSGTPTAASQNPYAKFEAMVQPPLPTAPPPRQRTIGGATADR